MVSVFDAEVEWVCVANVCRRLSLDKMPCMEDTGSNIPLDYQDRSLRQPARPFTLHSMYIVLYSQEHSL